mmetsp:Transcript_41442/g.67246  ORF Transcript_41442/g.67246 Transcript_41442/m.67246 type:complete len:447 (+) Transcript_41442:106-1446(+)
MHGHIESFWVKCDEALASFVEGSLEVLARDKNNVKRVKQITASNQKRLLDHQKGTNSGGMRNYARGALLLIDCWQLFSFKEEGSIMHRMALGRIHKNLLSDDFSCDTGPKSPFVDALSLLQYLRSKFKGGSISDPIKKIDAALEKAALIADSHLHMNEMEIKPSVVRSVEKMNVADAPRPIPVKRKSFESDMEVDDGPKAKVSRSENEGCSRNTSYLVNVDLATSEDENEGSSKREGADSDSADVEWAGREEEDAAGLQGHGSWSEEVRGTSTSIGQVTGVRNPIPVVARCLIGKQYKRLFVFDTCALMMEECLRVIEEEFTNVLDGLGIIPVAVVEELDKHKQSRELQKAKCAQEALKLIERQCLEGKFIAQSIREIIPDALNDPRHALFNDDGVLMCAMYFHKSYSSVPVWVVSEDCGLRVRVGGEMLFPATVKIFSKNLQNPG